MAAAATATSSTTAATAETTDGPASIRVNVLGPVEAFDCDGHSLACGAPKERHLLTLLAIHHGGPLSTDSLIVALWGDDPPDSCDKTVQTYVYRRRRAFGSDSIERLGGGYRLGVPAEHLDIAQAERLAIQAAAHRDKGRLDEAAAVYAEALRLFRGDAELPDTPVGDAVRRQIEETREQLLDALHDCRIQAGHAADVIVPLEAAVAATPYAERRWAQLMLALYRTGRQSDALAAFQRARRELVDGIGIEPGLALRALETQILEQDPALLAPAAGRAPSAAAFDPISVSDLSWIRADGFVGRDETVAQVENVWNGVVDSQARDLLLVDGDAGIGKTTLAARLAVHAADRGGVVWYGQCSPAGGGYQPVGDAIARYLSNASPDVVVEQVAGIRAELAHLVPGFQPDGAAPSLDPDSDQHRLFNAVGHLINDVAATAPLLLVVDDLHWASLPTMRLLHHLLRSNVARPILIVGTYRPSDLTPASPLRAVIGELHRTERVATVSLRGIDTEAIGQLIAAATGTTADWRTAAAEALHAATGGNPFFVREIIRHLVECGTFDDDASQATDLVGRTLPGSVREVIGLRLGRLDADTVAVLRVAAIAGLVFDIAVIAEVTGGVDCVLDAAEQATAVGVLVEAEIPDRYAFTHDLIRQAVLAEVSTTRRVRTHWAIATALAGRAASDPSEVAHHAHEGLLAGDPRQAAEWMRAAAADTLHRTAVETAMLHIERGLAAMDGVHGGHGPRADLLCDRAIGLIEAGASVTGPEFTEACAAAEAAAIASGDPTRIVRAVTLDDRSPPSSQIGVFDSRRVHAARGALDALPADATLSRAQVLSQIVAGYAHHADQTLAEAYTTEALALIDGLPAQVREPVVARLAVGAGCNPTRHHLIADMAAELFATGTPNGIGAAVQASTLERTFAADFDTVEATGKMIVQTGEDLGSSGMQVMGRTFLVGAASARGDIAALQDIMDSTVPDGAARHTRLRFSIKLHAAIALEMWTGLDHGGVHLGLVFANDPPPAAPFFPHGARIITAWTSSNVGDHERALDIWAPVRTLPIADACHGLLAILPAGCATELVTRYGTREEAQPIRVVLDAYPGPWVTHGPLALGPVDWYRAQLSAFLGDHERAALERRRALAACERAGLERWHHRITKSSLVASDAGR